MSADFPSSNPFRRKTPSFVPSQRSPSMNHHIAYQQTDDQHGSAGLKNIDAPKKVTKKVRVQSPPPSSPTTSYFPSTTGADAYSIAEKPPTPIPRDDDPFATTASADGPEDKGPSRHSKAGKAPANPFSKTLETMESRDREPPVSPPINNTSAGRASMDVDAFKKLLMTGIGGPGTTTTQTSSQAHITHALGDGESSTETSSVSRQSIFEAIQEAHADSPRTSHEISEPEDEPKYFTSEPLSYALGRKKPPPAPSSRHGKLIRLELRDDPPHISNLPPTSGSVTSPSYLSSSPHSQTEPNRSQTDLNKPLPPAPNRASHDSDRDSVFDKEALGKAPEPPSPSASIRRKTAPPPPATRRHSQLVSDSKLTQSNSGRLSPKAEEDLAGSNTNINSNSSFPWETPNRSRSNSNTKVPPPPPSRRLGSIRISSASSSHNDALRSPSAISLPAPPPTRGSSVRVSRTPSVMSMDLPAGNGNNNINKRSSMIAPPPPPHRHGRTSLEGSGEVSRRQSGEHGRRSIESARCDSISSSIQEERGLDVRGKEEGKKSRQDILADLSKLQREIDALRGQSEREREMVS